MRWPWLGARVEISGVTPGATDSATPSVIAAKLGKAVVERRRTVSAAMGRTRLNAWARNLGDRYEMPVWAIFLILPAAAGAAVFSPYMILQAPNQRDRQCESG
jgi:hypothetical protein